MTHLCVAIFIENVAQAKRDIATAIEAGADMIELRLDLFYDIPGITETLQSFDFPAITTCRPTWEGGLSELSDDERLTLLYEAEPFGSAEFIDIEVAAYRRLGSKEIGTRPLILSAHDFKGRPERLYNVIEEMNTTSATVNKIVWMARSIRDNIEAFEILKSKHKPTIALCMGEAGLISRVLAKKFGAFLTFASLQDESATAPGQVTVHDMKRLYRWDALNAKTKVYGVVGSPIMHSMSPAIHNAAFEAVGHDGVYLPMLVNPGYESFKAFMESFLGFPALDMSGLSITIPHKQNALRYLKEKGSEVEPLAERIGAVNTIIIERPHAQSFPRLRGINTDYAAILDTITSALNIERADLSGKRVAVLGAGGTGRTAVAALAAYAATVVVYNRTKERADALAEEFNGKRGKVVAARMEKLCDSCCQIYVNTTSLGMHPNVDASPLGDSPPNFGPDTLVFDMIYNPMQTKLLRDASQAGAKTVGGIEMFVRQAAGQFEAWTDLPAPRELMRRVIDERLGRA